MDSRKFTANDFLLRPGNPEKTYQERISSNYPFVKWGQRKLMITEVQFLTLFWDPEKVPDPIIVYAGAAHGKHISLLAQFFPEATFHLYDPRKFVIKADNKQIFIYNQLFTDQDAIQWSGRNNVYFICDIRSGQDDSSFAEFERAIGKDMKDQERWTEIMNPVYAHLKFRIPFLKEEFGQYMEYLYGYLFIQPWIGEKSTELRLVISGTSGKKIEWNTYKIESQMFYHNVEVRGKNMFINPFKSSKRSCENDKLIPISPPELLNDWDSLCEIIVLMNYIMKRRGINGIDEKEVLGLSEIITEHINTGKGKNFRDSLSLIRGEPDRISKRVGKETIKRRNENCEKEDCENENEDENNEDENDLAQE